MDLARARFGSGDRERTLLGLVSLSEPPTRNLPIGVSTPTCHAKFTLHPGVQLKAMRQDRHVPQCILAPAAIFFV